MAASLTVVRHAALRLAALAVLMVCGVGIAAAAELAFPPLTGRVVDAANILPATTRAALEARLSAQEAKTGDQLVVATVRSLEGTSIEDYANRLFRFWKLGQAKQNNGVLLLVAPEERKVRIEVGYGLEGILTDAVSGTIIRSAIVPDFKAGDMAGGVVRGTEAVLEILNLDPEEARRRAASLESDDSELDWISVVIFLLNVAFWIFVLYRFLRGGGSGRGRGAKRGSSNAWNWTIGSGAGRSSGGGGFSGGGFSGGGGSSGGGGASGGW